MRILTGFFADLVILAPRKPPSHLPSSFDFVSHRMKDEFLIVFCTFPDLENARRVIDQLVERRLIACGNILPGIESIYRWKEKIEKSSEVLAILKTTREGFGPLESVFKELHPYEVPELIATPIADGLPAYLGWISGNVG